LIEIQVGLSPHLYYKGYEMQNTYADIDTDLSSMLHGAARLHVTLGRMDDAGISTRGWNYNDLVDGILVINSTEDKAIKQYRCLMCLFDTLDAITEIGPRAVSYLHDLRKMVL
jgi:hypothetical protein